MAKPPDNAQLDIAANRRASKWSKREMIGRVLWTLATPFFKLSPRPMWAWRRLLLRGFGAKVGRDAHVYPSVRIAIPWHLEIGDQTAIGDRVILYSLGQIKIGKKVTISQYAHLCGGTHDYRQPDFRLIKAPITINDGAWICADAFIGPSRSVGQNAIVGARAVVMKDVPARAIVAGNPATVRSMREMA